MEFQGIIINFKIYHLSSILLKLCKYKSFNFKYRYNDMMCALGHMVSVGKGVPRPNIIEGLKVWKKAVKNIEKYYPVVGKDDTYYKLLLSIGMRYYDGIENHNGVVLLKKDYKKAFKYFNKGAKKG